MALHQSKAQAAQALIEQGHALQTSGDAAAARRLYERALALVPGHPTALQLMGLLAKEAGEPARAEALMRESLARFERQPHVWNNLANVLEGLGRRDEALSCLDRALAMQPTYAQAHYNRAALLFRAGLNHEALKAIESALAQSPPHPAPMMQLKAQVLQANGKLHEALRQADSALAMHPYHGPLHHNRGVLLHQMGRHQDALQAHEQALALGVDSADAHYNLGNSLQALGRLADALSAYRQACARHPHHRLALLDMARLRWRMGHAAWDEEMCAALNSSAGPDTAQLQGAHADLLWRAQNLPASLEAYRRAHLVDSNNARWLDGVARCQVRLGQADEGLACHHRALALLPNDAQLHASVATSLLLLQRHSEAALHAEQARKAAPLDQYSWALQGLAWRAAGDPRHHWLNNLQDLVKVVDLPPPSGWPDMARFNAALADELRALHVDTQAPVDQTLRGGTQTIGQLFDRQLPLCSALQRELAKAIESHIGALPTDDGHPLCARKGKGQWRYSDSWSSLLRDQGRHTNHVHPHGWISSVYYVCVPNVCHDATQQQGWLQFGEPDEALPAIFSTMLEIEPQVGRLVLFPSYLWHGTRPFSGTEFRLTIAFDVVPDLEPEVVADVAEQAAKGSAVL